MKMNKKIVIGLAVLAAFMMIAVPMAMVAQSDMSAATNPEKGAGVSTLTSEIGPVSFSGKQYAYTESPTKFATNESLGNNFAVQVSLADGIYTYTVTGNFGVYANLDPEGDAKAVWDSWTSQSFTHSFVFFASGDHMIRTTEDVQPTTEDQLTDGWYLFGNDALNDRTYYIWAGSAGQYAKKAVIKITASDTGATSFSEGSVAYKLGTGMTEDAFVTSGLKAGMTIGTETVYYESLVKAVAFATTGATVKPLSDLTIADTIVVDGGRTLTLDLNGKAITGNSDGDAIDADGNGTKLIMKDSVGTGTVTGEWLLNADHGATLQVDGGSYTSEEMTVWIGRGSTGIINGGTFTSNNNAVIGTPGNDGWGGNTVTVSDGTFIGNISSDGLAAGYIACGIYVANSDTVTISGGDFQITNGCGIAWRAGNITVTGGTFTTTGTVTGRVGDSTQDLDCTVFAVDTKSSYPGKTSSDTLTVSGGVFSSPTDDIIRYNSTSEVQLTVVVEGGSFNDLSALPYVKASSSVTLGSNYTVAQDSTATVLAGTTIIVPSEITLTVAGTLTNNGTIINNGTIDINNTTANKAQLVQVGGSITSTLSSEKGSIVNEAKWTTASTSYENHALVIKGGVFEKQNVTARNMADNHGFMSVTANLTNTVTVQNNTFTMARPNGIAVDNIGTGVVSFIDNAFVSGTSNGVESCIFIRGTMPTDKMIVSGTDITGVEKFAEDKTKGYAALVFWKYDATTAFSVGGLNSTGVTVKTDISSIGIKRGANSGNTTLDVKDNLSVDYVAVGETKSDSEPYGILNIVAGKTLTVTGKLDNYGIITNSGTLNAVGEIYLNTKGSATTTVGGHFIISDSGKLTIGDVVWIGANGTVVLSEGANADIITNIAGGFTATLNGIATIPQDETLVLATNDMLVANGQVDVRGALTIAKKEAASTSGNGKYVASSSATVTIVGTKWIASDGIVQLSNAATATLSTNTLGGFDCVLDGTAAIVSGKTLVIGEKDALTVNGKLTNAGTINNAGVINVDGTLTTTGTFATVGSINVGSSGKIDGAGTISFGAAASSTKVINVANGGVLTVTLDGTDTAAGAKESKVVLTAIAAGEGGITVTKGSVIIDGVIATPDAEGKIAIPAGSTVYVSGTVDEGVTLEIPATSVVVVPQGATLEVAAGAKVTNNGEIDVKSAGSEVIYEKGSVVNGVVIEVTTKEDNSGVHTVVIIWLVSEDPTKLAISENYVEAFSGAKYSEVLSLISVTPLRNYVTFTGWYNMAMNEKITLNDTVLPYEHYITACFDAEKRVPVPDEDVTPVIPDNTSGSSNVNEFALPIAFILLVCAIFALGFVIIRKK